jgi:succinoglycan biosynthesis transport protein ExoP
MTINRDMTQGGRPSEGQKGLPVERSSLQLPSHFRDEFGDSRFRGRLSPRDYVKMLFRHKWLIAGCFLLGVTVAAAYSVLATPYFRSSATLEVDERIRGTVQAHPASNIQEEKDYFVTQNEILKNTVLAELVIYRLHLDQSPEFQDETPEWLIAIKDKVKSFLNTMTGKGNERDPELEAARERERLVKEMMSRIDAWPVGKSRLIAIQLYAKDRMRAKTMLDAFIEAYLELNLKKRRSEDSDATQWLRSELARVKEELGQSRERLSEFTTKHGVVSLEGNLNHIVQGFTGASQDLLKSKEGLFKLRSFQTLSHVSSPRTVPALVNVDHLVKLKEQLALLESEHSKWKAVYDPSWTKVSILRKTIEDLRSRIAAFEEQTVGVVAEAASTEQQLLEQALEKAKEEAIRLNTLRVEYDFLKKELDSNEAVYQMYLQKGKEKEVSAGVTGNNVLVVTPPTVPVKPAKPSKQMNLLAGSFLGIMVGFLWASYKETSDRSIKTAEDVERQLSLPALGEIPNIRKFKRLHRQYLKNPGHGFMADHLTRSPLYDAIRNLQTSLSFMASHTPLHMLAVSSAGPEEGKTFVVVALATVMAEDNMRVLLMDCDMRRPTLARIFQKNYVFGLSDLLTEPDAGLGDSVNPTFVPNLYLMTSGRLPSNPVKLLRSQKMRDILDEARQRYDVVLMDCPPVLGFSEVPILATYADGVLLVIKEGALARKACARVLNSLPVHKFVGAVLNMSESEFVRYQARTGKAYYSQSHQKS